MSLTELKKWSEDLEGQLADLIFEARARGPRLPDSLRPNVANFEHAVNLVNDANARFLWCVATCVSEGNERDKCWLTEALNYWDSDVFDATSKTSHSAALDQVKSGQIFEEAISARRELTTAVEKVLHLK